MLKIDLYYVSFTFLLPKLVALTFHLIMETIYVN